MPNRRLAFALAVAVLPGAALNGQSVWYVAADARPGGDGMSWATAFDSLQDAQVAPPGSQIWVAEGVYTPAPPGGDQGESFLLRNQVELLGGFAGNELFADERDWVAHPTILSGDLNGDDVGFFNMEDNSQSVVLAEGVDTTGILDGFVITKGAGSSGAGMRVVQGAPTIRNCHFTLNRASGNGGGMSVDGATPTVQWTVFSNNVSDGWAGGAIYAVYGASVELDHCEIYQNESGNGGGLILATATACIKNCTFANNSAATWGGAIYLYDQSDAVILSTSFGGNSAFGGGSLRLFYSDVEVRNGILWGGSGGLINFAGDCDVAVSNSVVEGGFSGVGNLALDPQFVNEPGNDLHVGPESPCIDSGNNSFVPPDLVLDLDRHTRIQNAIVDIGAYESGETGCPWDCGDGDGSVGVVDLLTLLAQWSLPGLSCDVDEAGVGITDFLGLLANWGPCR